MCDPPEDLTLHLLDSLMAKMDRGDALEEARFAAMRQALGSARATVVATAYALTTFTDTTHDRAPLPITNDAL
jgi:hypothetical protein